MRQHLISDRAPLFKALEQLNRLSGETMTLFATDSDGRLTGSLTDGDIRRALLAGKTLEATVDGICRRECLRIERGGDAASTIAEARRRGVVLLPVVEQGVIVSLVDLRRQRGLVPADGVLMAGGIGERLRPLTEKTPKPLLPVGRKPIIDHNVELMHAFGIENIFVTVNYLKEQVIAHFGESQPGVTCVEEPKRLGTIGSLSLIADLKAPNVVVMNADLLTDINLEAMYLRHIDTEAWLTMAVIPYTVSVPYAIVDHQGDSVKGFTEKPTYNYYANAGIYMLRRDVVDAIPKGEYMDATDLIDRLLADGRRVSLYVIDGRWIDIGSPDDYRHACELMA
ncbi:MAG: NTP transferase domain-containing protein [Muribaculaceae bacterium]|nr:NTP transferase domain-containing protein [Muribaculaceae bacterium]